MKYIYVEGQDRECGGSTAECMLKIRFHGIRTNKYIL